MWQQAVLGEIDGVGNALSGQTTAEGCREDNEFKEEVIKDIFFQIDYQSAVRNQAVEMTQEELAQELRRLSTRALLSWYEAFLHIRAELMFAGYELNGFKILNRPFDAIHKLIEKDPYFDIRQYIF